MPHIFCHPINQQSYPCYHNFLTVTLSYHSKVNFVGPTDGENYGEADFLYVFNVGFPASLLYAKVHDWMTIQTFKCGFSFFYSCPRKVGKIGQSIIGRQ